MALPVGIGVVGSAGMGLYLAHLAASRGNRVWHYVPEADRRDELNKTRRLPAVLPDLAQVHPQVLWLDDLAELASNTRLVVLTGAPDPIEKTIDRLGEVLDGSHQIVHALHRLYQPELLTTSMLIRRRTCCLQIGALAGSFRLDEMLAGHPAAAVIGSSFPFLVEQVKRFLGGPQICLFGHPDLHGVEYAATLVEIIEVAMGLAEAQKLGDATQAMLMVRGLAEVARLGRYLGASAEAFEGLAGLAKLLVGVRRAAGPNFEVGRLIAQNVVGQQLLDRAPPDARGLALIGPVRRFATENDIPMPITSKLDEVRLGHLKPQDFIREVVSISGQTG